MTATIGRRLKSIREASHLTQQELADKLNVSRPLVARIEGDTTMMSFPLAIQISEVLDCTLDDLAGRRCS